MKIHNQASALLIWAIAFAATGAAEAASASLAAAPLAAKDIKFKETNLELQSGDRLIVSGIRGSVRLLASGGNDAKEAKAGPVHSTEGRAVASAFPNELAATDAANSMQASGQTSGPVLLTLRGRKTLNEKGLAQWSDKFEALTMQTRREGHALIVEIRGPKSKTDWVDWTATNSPEMNIEISMTNAPGRTAAVVPVEVSLHDGLIQTQGWHGPVAVSVVQGTIRTSETQGDLQVQLQRGDIHIADHHGAVDVDSFGGKLFVDRIEGDLHLDNFSGESSLKNVAGNVFVRTHAGGTNVVDSSGAIDFELGRGALTVTKFEGPVRGQTDSAPVIAKLEGESDVNIESAQGPVAVRLPASSGAIVRLQTDTGSLNAPEEIHPSQTASSKLATGRMKGTGPKGMVSIKSKAASIRVRPEPGVGKAASPAGSDAASASDGSGE